MSTLTDLYDYELPSELIAQFPADRRDASRLLVLDRRTGVVRHHQFSELPNFLRPGDLLIVNDSRVFKARLFLEKDNGAKIELLFLRPAVNHNEWVAMARPAKRLRAGAPIRHPESGVEFTPVERDGEKWRIAIPDGLDLLEFLDQHGVLPLPPYIKSSDHKPDRYQTVYASNAGSAAAPTAGLHFTNELMERIRQAQCEIEYVTLHIGLDTFRPISTDIVEDHPIHSEWCAVPHRTAEAVVRARREGRRIVAVGTTSVRALESWARAVKTDLWKRWLDGDTSSGAQGDTNLFITDGYEFCVVDAMITNFHLPRTTLLAMVSTFAGRENLLAAYAEAVRERYRFFSFGDAMFITDGNDPCSEDSKSSILKL